MIRNRTLPEVRYPKMTGKKSPLTIKISLKMIGDRTLHGARLVPTNLGQDHIPTTRSLTTELMHLPKDTMVKIPVLVDQTILMRIQEAIHTTDQPHTTDLATMTDTTKKITVLDIHMKKILILVALKKTLVLVIQTGRTTPKGIIKCRKMNVNPGVTYTGEGLTWKEKGLKNQEIEAVHHLRRVVTPSGRSLQAVEAVRHLSSIDNPTDRNLLVVEAVVVRLLSSTSAPTDQNLQAVEAVVVRLLRPLMTGAHTRASRGVPILVVEAVRLRNLIINALRHRT